jgi:hypothetical protein
LEYSRRFFKFCTLQGNVFSQECNDHVPLSLWCHLLKRKVKCSILEVSHVILSVFKNVLTKVERLGLKQDVSVFFDIPYVTWERG